MKYSALEYTRLWGLMKDRLRKKAENIVFLELKKDVCYNDKVVLSKDVPLPIKPDLLVKGIKNDEFSETLSLEKIIGSMVYLVGCDESFRYNGDYIRLIRQLNPKIEDILIHDGIKFANEGSYLDGLIYFLAADKISHKHMWIRYNIANILKEMASCAKGKSIKNDFELYYSLSFMEFYKLSMDYPDFADVHYHLGFYYLRDNYFHQALLEWEKACEGTLKDDIRGEIEKLADEVKMQISFEKGKSMVVGGDALEGLKILLPIVQKYDAWIEAKYYTALGYRKLGNYKMAEVWLKEILDKGIKFPRVYNELGLCYFNMGMLDESVKCFSEAVSMDGDNPGYLCNLGIAWYQMGQTSKAEECINKAYNIDPNDELTIKCRERLILK